MTIIDFASLQGRTYQLSVSSHPRYFLRIIKSISKKDLTKDHYIIIQVNFPLL